MAWTLSPLDYFLVTCDGHRLVNSLLDAMGNALPAYSPSTDRVSCPVQHIREVCPVLSCSDLCQSDYWLATAERLRKNCLHHHRDRCKSFDQCKCIHLTMLPFLMACYPSVSDIPTCQSHASGSAFIAVMMMMIMFVKRGSASWVTVTTGGKLPLFVACTVVCLCTVLPLCPPFRGMSQDVFSCCLTSPAVQGGPRLWPWVL